MNARSVCRQVEFLPPTSDVDANQYRLVAVALSWTPDEPHVVSATFRVGLQKQKGWVLGRELLGEGLLYPVGMGDVFLTPDPFDPWSVVLVLSSDSGRPAIGCPPSLCPTFWLRLIRRSTRVRIGV